MKFNDKEYEYTQVIRAYEILGVPLCSDYHSITKKAFYRLAKQFHPDRHSDNPKLAAKKFTKVGAAKDYLEKI